MMSLLRVEILSIYAIANERAWLSIPSDRDTVNRVTLCYSFKRFLDYVEQSVVYNDISDEDVDFIRSEHRKCSISDSCNDCDFIYDCIKVNGLKPIG